MISTTVLNTDTAEPESADWSRPGAAIAEPVGTGMAANTDVSNTDTAEPAEQAISAPGKRATVIDIPIYGSFTLAGSEFALSATSIQEVVNEPDAYSQIPLSPGYLLGVFNLRGNIVPVVDLRKIFLLSDECLEGVERRKVVIIECGKLSLGLLVDSTGEVFNSRDVEQCLFESRGNSTADQVVAGVFKMNDGHRIVQILDVDGMLQLDKVPHSSNQKTTNAIKNRGTRQQCISFRVGESCCALDIGEIREIVNIGSIDNAVMAGRLSLGTIDIRGDTVPVVNFSLLLGYVGTQPASLSESDSHRVVVMNVQDTLIGLLVDSIQNIVAYYSDELIEFPILAETKAQMFKGCVPASSDNEHTIVLRHSEILSDDELTEVTRGQNQLFNDSMDVAIRERKDSLDRKTLITFSLGYRFGLDIRDVKEVIDYPDKMIQTPNMADHIRGMVNLRGELVAVIDSRVMYGMDEADHETGCKVLIYEKAGAKQGLMVDSVDSIVPFCQSDVVKVPGIVFKERNSNIDKDVQEAIMIDVAGHNTTVCILDINAVSRRACG